jgi:hypothetical protein
MNNEYWDKVKQNFYKQVRETNWGITEERVCRARGRKAKPRVIAEQILRSKQEYKRVPQTKFFNFN